MYKSILNYLRQNFAKTLNAKMTPTETIFTKTKPKYKTLKILTYKLEILKKKLENLKKLNRNAKFLENLLSR